MSPAAAGINRHPCAREGAAVFLDIALAYDRTRRRVDVVYDPATGRIVLDRTPATPVMISLGCDRRAEPDDTLPDGTTEGSLQAGLNPRRGCSGDAFAPAGQLTGSRIWLYSRSKLTDEVLLDVQDCGTEATDWIAQREGVPVECAASRPARNVLRLDVRVGDQVVTVQRAVAA